MMQMLMERLVVSVMHAFLEKMALTKPKSMTQQDINKYLKFNAI